MGTHSMEQLQNVLSILWWFVAGPCGVFDLVRWLKGKPWFPTYFIADIPFELLIDMLNVALGRSAIINVIFGGANAYYVYCWWKQKPPSNRRKSRVLSRVKRLNGRLVLVPVTQ
jgi:hypothetical protein